MVNYTQKNVNTKKKYPKSKILGIVLVSVSLFMLLFTSVNWLYFIKSFFLGTFGVMCYPVFAFMLLFGVAFLTGRKFVMSKKYLIYLLSAFLCIIAIFHIIFTAKLDNSSFGKFLADCYNTKFTPGGLLIGLFTYPVTGLLNSVAGGVLYGIILAVIIALIIDYLYAFRQYSKLLELKAPQEEPEEITPNEPQQVAPQLFQTIIDQKQEPQEEVFEEEEEIEKEPARPIELSPREIARQRLNLGSKLTQEITEEEKPKKSLFDTKLDTAEEFMGRGIVDNKPPKINDEKKSDGKDYLRDFINKTYGIETKPNNVNIINNSNYSNAFTKKEEVKIEPTIQTQEKTPVSPIITNTEFAPKQAFSQSKPKIEQTQTSFDSFFEPKKVEPIIEKPIEQKPLFESKMESVVPVKEETNNIISFDDEEEKPKGISPLNPKAYEVEDSFDTPPVDDDEIKPVVEPIKPEIIIDNSAQIATANPISNSLQKDVELNVDAPPVNNGIDINYVQQFIRGTEKKKQKPVRKYTKPSNYVRPPLDLLTVKSVDPSAHSSDEQEKAAALENLLAQFKIEAKVIGIRRGAAVTRYELQMPLGITVNKISQHANDIAMVLRSNGDVRIQTPIRGKAAVGVEVPNDTVDTVGLRDILESPKFTEATCPLTFGLGKDVDGSVFTCDIHDATHLLVAGSTKSGKSVCLNALIVSLLYKASPDDLKLILIDPKKVEFKSFNYLPHMLVPTAITEAKKALNAFDWLIMEMENRYQMMEDQYVRNLEEYNDLDKVHNGELPKLPYIVLIVDEYADLQDSLPKKTDLEERIRRLAAKARAAGIHLIIATQRPSVNVVTGVIKNNLPTKIAFAVGDNQSSRTILGVGGAEKLLGRGDMLYSFNNQEPTRVQGAFITTEEVNNICNFVRENNLQDFDEDIEAEINSDKVDAQDPGADGGSSNDTWDPLMKEAVRFVIEIQRASSSIVQRKFAIGYNRAARITDQMYAAKFIGPSEGGSKPRAVYITKEQFSEIFGEEF